MMKTRHGALVISLDFELHWGVHEITSPYGSYRQNLLGTWEAVPRILALFEEYDIAATWATVGFLFAKSRRELEEFSPSIKPQYSNSILSPYNEPIGEDETDDPLHFAPSLIETIRQTPRQELATHTFSHYFCLEPGQTREAFESDLDSALAIASKNGIQFRSLVFPRDQHNPDYDTLLVDKGIVCYRGPLRGWIYRSSLTVGERQLKRPPRLLDRYIKLTGSHTVSWDAVQKGSKLCNIPGSFFLWPYSPSKKLLEPLRLRRIAESIRRAAVCGEVFHLWWHPENFGIHIDQNVDFLRKVLESFCYYRDTHGIRSMSMVDAAAVARRKCE
jgi:peptidoglycan/xylan/chitin deacetylase (PgdA/CDA1 family)